MDNVLIMDRLDELESKIENSQNNIYNKLDNNFYKIISSNEETDLLYTENIYTLANYNTFTFKPWYSGECTISFTPNIQTKWITNSFDKEEQISTEKLNKSIWIRRNLIQTVNNGNSNTTFDQITSSTSITNTSCTLTIPLIQNQIYTIMYYHGNNSGIRSWSNGSGSHHYGQIKIYGKLKQCSINEMPLISTHLYY